MWLDVIAVLLAVLVLLGVITGARALPWLMTVRRRRIVVVLDTEQALEGILFRRRGALFELREVALHREGGPLPVDGAVIVERARIVWMQVPS
jgi:hypothetical protein